METQGHFPDSIEALEKLKAGNARFVQGIRSPEYNPTPEKLKALAEQGQRPFCIILTCADSRVPAELVFDQGLGDLFVIRVAGNVIAPSLLASLEFATVNFETSLVLVMGHSRCGAIQATIDAVRNNLPAASHNIEDLIDRIMPAVKLQLPHHTDPVKLWDACIAENVKNTIKKIFSESDIVQERVKQKKLMVAGAVFCLDTGKVDFDLELF